MSNAPMPRWLIGLWLVLSQLGGALLAIAPIVVIGAIAMLTLGGGGMPSLFGLTCLSIILPIAFAIAAWIAFARHKHTAAVIFSGICLLVGALLYFAMDAFTRYFNN